MGGVLVTHAPAIAIPCQIDRQVHHHLDRRTHALRPIDGVARVQFAAWRARAMRDRSIVGQQPAITPARLPCHPFFVDIKCHVATGAARPRPDIVVDCARKRVPGATLRTAVVVARHRQAGLKKSATPRRTGGSLSIAHTRIHAVDRGAPRTIRTRNARLE